MKRANNKVIAIIMLLLTINIHAASLEERLLNKETQKEAIKELWKEGEKAMPRLKGMLKNENKEIRQMAIVRLGELKAGKEEILGILSKEKEQSLRTLAVFSLMKIKDRTTIPALKNRALDKTITDEDRMVAIIGLGNIETNYDENKEIFNKALNDESGIVRMRAAYFMAKNGDTNCYGTIMQNVKSEDQHVREYALEAIGNLGNIWETLDKSKQNEIEQTIKTAEKDIAIWVRIAGKTVNRQIEMNKLLMPYPENSKERNEKMIEYLKNTIEEDEQYEVQIWASEEMLRTGENGKNVLMEIAKSKTEGARAAGKTLVRAGIK